MLQTTTALRAVARRCALAASLVLALATSVVVAACQGEANAKEPGPIRFTAIPERDTTELAKKYAPLADHLTKAVGVPFEYVPSADYAASVDMFANGDVLLAWFGGMTHVQARARVPGAQAIAAGKVDPQYKSYFITHPDSGLERKDTFPHEIASLKFTFGSDQSTSGRLMPTWFITQETGRSPEEFFGVEALHYSGAHDKTIELVKSRAFDVGAVDYKTYDKLVGEGKVDPAEVPIIWVTPPYVDYNFTIHPDIERIHGAETVTRLREALVALDDPALLGAMNRPEGMVAVSNDDFEMLDSVARKLGLVR